MAGKKGGLTAGKGRRNSKTQAGKSSSAKYKRAGRREFNKNRNQLMHLRDHPNDLGRARPGDLNQRFVNCSICGKKHHYQTSVQTLDTIKIDGEKIDKVIYTCRDCNLRRTTPFKNNPFAILKKELKNLPKYVKEEEVENETQ